MRTIIVGNSDSLIDAKNGVVIDQFDQVVRCNRAPLKGFAYAVGEKQDLRFVNDHLARGSEHEGNTELDWSEMAGEMIFTSQEISPSEFAQRFPSDCRYIWYSRQYWKQQLFRYDFEISKVHNPSIGFEAICYFLGQDVTITGFDLSDDHIFQHYWNVKRKRNSTYHKWDYEKKTLREIIDRGMINVL